MHCSGFISSDVARCQHSCKFGIWLLLLLLLLLASWSQSRQQVLHSLKPLNPNISPEPGSVCGSSSSCQICGAAAARVLCNTMHWTERL